MILGQGPGTCRLGVARRVRACCSRFPRYGSTGPRVIDVPRGRGRHDLPLSVKIWRSVWMGNCGWRLWVRVPKDQHSRSSEAKAHLHTNAVDSATEARHRYLLATDQQCLPLLFCWNSGVPSHDIRFGMHSAWRADSHSSVFRYRSRSVRSSLAVCSRYRTEKDVWKHGMRGMPHAESVAEEQTADKQTRETEQAGGLELALIEGSLDDPGHQSE